MYFVIISNSLQCNTKGTLGKLSYSVKKGVLKDWPGYNHIANIKSGAGRIQLLPADALRMFFRKHAREAFPEQNQEADGVETTNREEVAPQGGGEASIEAREDERVEDEGGYLEGEEDPVNDDPFFNSSNGCLRWTLEDVIADDVEEEAGGQLSQEDGDVSIDSRNTGRKRSRENGDEYYDAEEANGL